MKILITNDIDNDMHLLKYSLEKHNHEVVHAADGIDALETLRKNHFDIIISDILMPYIDGFQLCWHCKSDKTLKKIPFIFFTSLYTTQEDKEYAMNIGADEYITKPLEPNICIDRILKKVNEYKNGHVLSFKTVPNKHKEPQLKEYNEYLIKKLKKRILDLKKSNKKLKEQKEDEARSSKLSLTATSGVVVFDNKGNIHYWDHAAEKIFGYTAKETEGKSIFQFINPLEENFIDLANLSPEFVSKTIQTEGIRKDKKKFPLEIFISTIPLRNKVHAIGIFHDINEQKQIETKKKRKEAILQLIAEISNIAHEVITVKETALVYLKKICKCMGWQVGHIYALHTKSSREEVIKSTKLWYFEDQKQYNTLKKISEGTVFKPGEDLPGRVYVSKRMVWVSDVTKDINLTRTKRTKIKNKNLNIKGAFAFPIMEGGNIIYILEFFSKNAESPQPLWLEALDNLALQFGRVIEKKRAEEKILRLSQVVEQNPASIVITDKRARIEYVNPKFTQITGYAMQEVIGQTPRIFKSGKTPDEQHKILWETINSGKEWREEVLNKKKNGEVYWEDVHISPIRNSKGTITHYLAIKEDITDRKRFETQLVNMATQDPLTNLLNRRRFLEELEYWVAQANRYDTYATLLFLDLDNFKYINDTLGHQAGDELLIRLAEMLRDRLRDTDILARFGGDEFAIILPHTDREHAQLISKQILDLTRELTFDHFSVSFSIGIASLPEHGRDSETILKHADLAMYKAKEEGRNRFCIFSYKQKMHVEPQISWEKRIRTALQNDQFELYLQPVIDLTNNSIVGYEALLRMIDQEKGLIGPSEFLNIAERFGLLHDIDCWVVRQAINLIKEFQFSRRGIFLDVNLSGKAFTNTELLNIIKQELHTCDINPKSIIFEISETATIENMIEAQHFFTTLKEIECRFSLDDFGRGFSSFNYLKHLPVDYLKINGNFVLDLTNNTVDQHLVKAMVEVAHGLGKMTIAEFVGSEETLNLLKELGVNYAQGYYIGKPAAISTTFTN